MKRSRWNTRGFGGAAVASPVAAIGAVLLATDNLIGFAGRHVLSAELLPVVVVMSVSAGVLAAIWAAVAHDAARLVIAAAGIGFVLILSPAIGGDGWPSVAVSLQAVVPLMYASAAVLLLRRPRIAAGERLVSVLLLGLGLGWAVAGLVPVDLIAFLVVQAGTLLPAAAVELRPALRRALVVTHELWTSADVR